MRENICRKWRVLEIKKQWIGKIKLIHYENVKNDIIDVNILSCYIKFYMMYAKFT